MRENDLPLRVDVWDHKDSHIEEIIALTSDFATAKSAYDEAVKRRPGRFVTLREKARVIHRTRSQPMSTECERCQHPHD
jgi:hypothetical protein